MVDIGGRLVADREHRVGYTAVLVCVIRDVGGDGEDALRLHLNPRALSGDTITATYKATVTALTQALTNTATSNFSNDPYDAQSMGKASASMNLYTTRIAISKVAYDFRGLRFGEGVGCGAIGIGSQAIDGHITCGDRRLGAVGVHISRAGVRRTPG